MHVCVCVSHGEEQKTSPAPLYLSLCLLFPCVSLSDCCGRCGLCFSCPQVVHNGIRHQHRTFRHFMVSISFSFAFKVPVEAVCTFSVPLLYLDVMRIVLLRSLSRLSSSTFRPLHTQVLVFAYSRVLVSHLCATRGGGSPFLSLSTTRIQRNGKTSSDDYKQEAAPAGIQCRSAPPFFFVIPCEALRISRCVVILREARTLTLIFLFCFSLPSYPTGLCIDRASPRVLYVRVAYSQLPLFLLSTPHHWSNTV